MLNTSITVSQLNLYVKSLIEGDTKLAFISVTGEISNFKDHYSSGHWYFTLKDSGATVRCVMFKSSAMRVKFKPEDGMSVTVKGRVSLYEKDGQYQFYAEDMSYVLEHFDDLVLKDVAEAGGYGVVFGSKMTKEQKENFINLLKAEPRRFIAQEVIDFQDLDIMEEGAPVPRKADLRAFVLMADEPLVWKSGLTRFSRNPDSFIVNSSQGGGFKDTWVLSQ